jgi:hypothetical protein
MRRLRAEIEGHAAALAESTESAGDPPSRILSRERADGATPARAHDPEPRKTGKSDQPGLHKARTSSAPSCAPPSRKPGARVRPELPDPGPLPQAPPLPRWIEPETSEPRGPRSVPSAVDDVQLVQDACISLGNISRKAVAGLLSIPPSLLWRVERASLPQDVREALQEVVEGGKRWRTVPSEKPSGIWLREGDTGCEPDP